MNAFAYKIVRTTWDNISSVEPKLNKLGLEGWRVVDTMAASNDTGKYFVWTLERVGAPRSPDQGRV